MSTTEPATPPLAGSHDLITVAELLLSTDTFVEFLEGLVNAAAVQTKHSCSITVRLKPNKPYTLVATGELPTRLDEEQYSRGQGPCLDAARTNVPIFVMDMLTETRWDSYPQQASELGVRSMMSHPLNIGGGTVGALNMYAFADLAPDVGRNARAAQIADRAAGAIAIGLQLAEKTDEAANLRTALTSRSVIDQAMGVLMAQQQCGPDEAFQLLRKASQGRNVKLRELADQIVASVQRQEADKLSVEEPLGR